MYNKCVKDVKRIDIKLWLNIQLYYCKIVSTNIICNMNEIINKKKSYILYYLLTVILDISNLLTVYKILNFIYYDTFETDKCNKQMILYIVYKII